MSSRDPRMKSVGRSFIGKAALVVVWTCWLLRPLESAADQLATWASQTSGTTNDFYAIAYGQGTFVAVGIGGQLCSSTDGASWTPQASGTTNDLEGVSYGNGLFVAMGGNGSTRTSTNGTTWVGHLSGFNSAFHAVTYGNGLYVAVGFGGAIFISNSGTNWIQTTSPTTNSLQAVRWANGMYVASGFVGTIVTSTDGSNWTSRVSGTPNALHTVTYGAGTFVVAGFRGDLRTSPDGVAWTSQVSGTTNSLRGAVYTNSNFVLTGFRGTIISSTDGTNWIARNSGETNALRGIAYGAGTFVTAGHRGRILQSAVAAAAPTITCPPDVSTNICGSSVAVSFANPTVTGGGLQGCVPASGSVFAVGTSAVTCTVTNASATNTCTFTVTVAQIAAPTITCPPNVSTNVCGSSVAVSFANPAVTGGGLRGCVPTSGSVFAVGTNVVVCTVTNACATNTCSFNVTVAQIAAPMITCPVNVTTNICGSGVAVSFANPTVTGGALRGCVPASGSVFAAGVNAVVCTVTNACVTNTCSFNVTVAQIAAPTVTCPANVSTNVSGSSVAVSFANPTVTGGGWRGCVPASGSVFAVGVNAVVCTVTNACATNTCSFNVTVAQIAAPTIINVSFSGHTASFAFATESGLIYRLEYKNTLSAPTWTALFTVNGNGGLITTNDPTATISSRFYRVAVQ